MVNFLLLNENINEFNKKDIDKGFTPQKVYEICSCIRETFCISYSIRKSNNLYLYYQKEQVLIKFEGNKLRYLGPDERSQALLLNRALKKLQNIDLIKRNTWSKSTPGIFVRKFINTSSFLDFYKSIAIGRSFLILENPQFSKRDVLNFDIKNNFFEIVDNDFFIIPIYWDQEFISNIIELFKNVKKIKILSFSEIKEVENKILYINFRNDQQRMV